jgi:plasmid maintenance system killer protein
MTIGATNTFDMQAFAAQSEARTIQTMQLNQRQADMAAIKELHTSKLKQDQDNAKSVSDMAKVPSDEGKKAAEAFNR